MVRTYVGYGYARMGYAAQELGAARYLRVSAGAILPLADPLTPRRVSLHVWGISFELLSSMLPLDKRWLMLYFVGCPAWGE